MYVIFIYNKRAKRNNGRVILLDELGKIEKDIYNLFVYIIDVLNSKNGCRRHKNVM